LNSAEKILSSLFGFWFLTSFFVNLFYCWYIVISAPSSSYLLAFSHPSEQMFKNACDS